MFLAAAAVAALLHGAGPARAIGPNSEFVLTLVGPEDALPSSAWRATFRQVTRKVRDTTSVPIREDVRVIRLSRLHEVNSPFVIMPLDRIPAASPDEVARVVRPFLRAGGTIWIISAGAWSGREPLNEWVHDLVSAAAPRARMGPIARDHVVYRSFFELSRQGGITLEGARLGRRLAILHSPSWLFAGQRRVDRRLAQLAVNVVEYALCQDYKDEQTHIDYLLKRRDWKTE